MARATPSAVFRSRAPVRPPTSPPSTRSCKGRPIFGFPRRRRELGDIGLGIRQRIEIEIGIAGELLQHIADGALAQELIGHHHPADAGMADRLELLHRADGDAPGPVVDLALEELGTHGGLAMGRDHGAGAREEAAHPIAVMRQGALADHRQRQRQILAQQVPALLADLAEGGGRDPAGHALDAVVDGGRLRSGKGRSRDTCW